MSTVRNDMSTACDVDVMQLHKTIQIKLNVLFIVLKL
jgi:hypothetical protein